ncbi:DUF2147 domain-containing protein [Sansalvadorimonas verongulae]|uniref:DUF2147 domain-containing protein n=1 Tax=Sansalvadorimonas verongulae TaxID=2172824 RepID=UPI0018AD285E|nr:DUF2147 domain-containing protein [Sansalvadorimonas verongulae]
MIKHTDSVKAGLYCAFTSAVFSALMAPSSYGASGIDGLWDILDDTGTLDTTLHIYQRGDTHQFEGKAVILHRPQDQGAICSGCSGERYNQPIKGMIVLENMEKSPKRNAWYGRVLDPESGKTYSARLVSTNDNNALELCVYIATDRFCLSRQTWTRSKFTLPEG